MLSRSQKIQSNAFTADLTPYMEAARGMYPGGRFQRFIRAFDTIFHRGMVQMVDTHHAMVLADSAQRERLDDPAEVDTGRQKLPDELGRHTMRELVLRDLYHRQDSGEQLPPGLIAEHEGQVQSERLAATQGTPTEQPFQPSMSGVLPAGAVIGVERSPEQHTPHNVQ